MLLSAPNFPSQDAFECSLLPSQDAFDCTLGMVDGGALVEGGVVNQVSGVDEERLEQTK